MQPISPRIPANYSNPSVSTGQQVESQGAQAQHNHPDVLLNTRLSGNALSSLSQAAESNENSKVVDLVRKALKARAFRFRSADQTGATYDAPSETGLSIKTRLNDRSEYDIVGASLYVPKLNETVSIRLPIPPAVTRRDDASGMAVKQASSSEALQARGHLVQARIDQYGLPNQGMVHAPQGIDRLRAVASTQGLLAPSVTLAVADMNDPKLVDKFNDFIDALDEDSLEKRFDEGPRPVFRNLKELGEHVILAEKNGKIIGCTDYSTDSFSYKKNKVARVNMVVNRANQGQGIGKALLEKRADELMNRGYEYVVGNIYTTNQEHIDRLARKGWQMAAGLGNEYDSEDEDEDEKLLTFWKPLKPELANQEPS
jgi:GNAT superfamily N-acetyltransferase